MPIDAAAEMAHSSELAMPRPAWDGDWRIRLRAVAEANRALFAAHPWAARISTARPPLGPGVAPAR